MLFAFTTSSLCLLDCVGMERCRCGVLAYFKLTSNTYTKDDTRGMFAKRGPFERASNHLLVDEEVHTHEN